MDEERPGPPELGSEEARERIRRSGVPLDEWEAWPPSPQRQAQYAAERSREDLWFRSIVALVFAIGIAVLIWSVMTSSPPQDGEVCQDERGAFIC